MTKNFSVFIIIQFCSFFSVNVNCQNIDTTINKKFTGELIYNVYTDIQLFEDTPQTLELKSFLERPTEQIHSYEEDILITAISLGDTLQYSLCSDSDVYAIFPPSKKKLRFKSSNENDFRNFTRTDEYKLISGFNCNKFYYQLNDNILKEKWITSDFGYYYPLENKDHCYSTFSEAGLEVARKSTIHLENGDVHTNEFLLTKHIYEPSYVRSMPKVIIDELNVQPIDYQLPALSDTYKSIPLNMRQHIQIDSVLDTENVYINTENLFDEFTLITFWASWCKPCLNNMPKVEEIYKLFSKDGLNVLSVLIDHNVDHAEWLELVGKYNMKWSNVRAEAVLSEKIKRELEITTIPKYLLIDRNGYLVVDAFEAIHSDNLISFLNELITDTE